MWTYTEAEAEARAQMKAGHIIRYCTGYTRERGRYIEVETDQGWNPDPFWQERPDDPVSWPAPPI